MRHILRPFISSHRARARTSRYRAMNPGNADYSVTVSAPAALSPVPETAREKSHWVRDGDKGEPKGFVNPWKSAYDFTFPEMFKAMMQ